MTVKEFLQAIKKGAVTTASGGQLNAENATKFINTVIENNNLFGTEIEVLPMKASQRQIDVIGLASRVMRGATEGTAPAGPVGVNIKRRTLSYKEAILPYDVSLNFLEENIEGADVDALLLNMFSTQFGNDQIDLSVNGDESLDAVITDVAPADGFDDTTLLSQDDHDFLRQNDGWKVLVTGDADTHAVALGDSTTRDFKDIIFPALVDSLPNKWVKDKTKLSIYCSPKSERLYRRQLVDRNTALGDMVLTDGRTVRYDGIDIVPMPDYPDTLCVITLKKNKKVGIGRNIRVGRQVQERKRIVEYTITAKTDCEIAVADAVGYVELTTA